VSKAIKKPIKHIPQRTCVGCREVLAKRSLVRIVRTAQGVQLDPIGKIDGRGAYLHNKRSCWERALKGALSHALKMELSEQDYQVLRGYLSGLPSEEESKAE
jgi:predicted RNA-binding protein YlxR (DUF448 family)